MTLSTHTKRALTVIAAAMSLDFLLGWLFALVQHIALIDGLYYAVTTGSTVGYGDIYPTHPLSKLITVIMELTVIPLFAAAYSLMTANLTTSTVTRGVNKHIDKKHEEFKNESAARWLGNASAEQGSSDD